MKKKLSLVWVLLLPLFMQAQTASVGDEVKRLLTRAKTAYNMGEYQDALAEYQKAQRLVPDYPDLYKVIAEVYEKLGGDDDLNAAIKSYNQYLKLSPNAEDKNAIVEKMAALEYLHEKQVKQTKILDDLSGIWVSDLNKEMKHPNANKSESMMSVMQSVSKQKKDKKTKEERPFLISRISEIGKTGKFRIELLEECGFYSESIIQKVVNINPDKKNNITFTFADAQTHNTSTKYTLLRLGTQMAGLGNLGEGLANMAITAAEANDLPSNTKTAYQFDLQYANGELTGYCTIVQQQDKNNSSKQTYNDIFEITLAKNDDYYSQINFGKRSKTDDMKVKMQENPDLFKQWQHGRRISNTGIVLTSFGVGCALGGIFVDVYGDSYILGPVMFSVGAGCALVGTPLIIGGIKQQKRAVNEHNSRLDNKRNATSLNFGITPSGGIGLVYNF